MGEAAHPRDYGRGGNGMAPGVGVQLIAEVLSPVQAKGVDHGASPSGVFAWAFSDIVMLQRSRRKGNTGLRQKGE